MSINLGKFNDIPIRIHWSFSLLFSGIIVLIAITKGVQTGLLWGIGLFALFISVLIHEYAHAWTAGRFGYPTEEIVLYPLGGASKIEEIPTNSKQEFLIVFMGPVTNYAIALLAGIGAYFLAPTDYRLLGRHFGGLIQYYAYLNLGLGLFNMFTPAIPMDGGRLLRSILSTRMPFPKATIISVNISRVVAVIMGLVGFVWNPWLLLIAFFIYVSGSSEMEESITRYLLEDIPVQRMVNTDLKTINIGMTVDDLLDLMIEEGHLGYLVTDNNEPVGVVTLSDVRKIPKEERSETNIEQMMTPEILTVNINHSAKDTLAILKEKDIGRLFVEQDNKIIGIITRSDIIKYVKIRGVKRDYLDDQVTEDTIFMTS